MPNLYGFDFRQFGLFLLVLFRVAAILYTAPLTGSNSIPQIVKISLALIFSLFIFNLIPKAAIDLTRMDSWAIAVLVFKELLIGVMIGFIPKVISAAIELAGSLISNQIGLGLADIIDPMTGNRVQIISDFKDVLSLLVFLGINAHYMIFNAILLSFEKIPFGGLTLSQGLYNEVLEFVGDLFIIGFKLAAPVIAVLVLVNLIMGLLARSMPQMNIFMVGLPVTVFLGLFILALGVPITTAVFEDLWLSVAETTIRLINLAPLP